MLAVETLPDMTITAPRQTLEQLVNSPYELDHDEITNMHKRSIDDVLRGLPGFTTSKLGGYGQPDISLMRSAGGQGLMLLDDIPLLQTIPGSQFSDSLPSEAIQSATVQRGPTAAYNAFQALGGTIRLSTMDREETGAKVSVEGGSFGILRETLQTSLAGSLGRVTMTLSRGDAFDGTHFATATNNPERDPFRFSQGILRFSSDLSHRINWQGSMLYRQSWSGTDKFGLDKQKRVELQDDPQSFGKQETWLAQNKLNVQVTDTWKSQLQLGFTQARTFVQAGLSLNSVFSRLYLINWKNQHTLINDPDKQLQWQVFWGGQGRYEQGRSDVSGFSQNRTMAAGFISSDAQYGKLSGEAGVRVEQFGQFGTQPLFRTAAALQIMPSLTLRASGGTGFRLPSYNELLFLFFGNRQLRPERSVSGDLSIEWFPFKNWHITATGFYHHYQDLISIVWEPRRGPITDNVPSVRTAGVELDMQYAWTDNFDSGLSYTYSNNRDLNSGHDIPLRPQHSGKIWQQWHLQALPIILRLETFYRGSTWNDFANTLPVKDAVQINASIRYAVTPKLELYLRGENLTNNRNSPVFSIDTPGIAVYGGIRLDM